MKRSDIKHQPPMQRKVFLGIYPPEYLRMKKDADSTTSFSIVDILSGELIPGRLLLSRACFRFSSTTQNSSHLTIFTTCSNSQPLSRVSQISKRPFLIDSSNPTNNAVPRNKTVHKKTIYRVEIRYTLIFRFFKSLSILFVVVQM